MQDHEHWVEKYRPKKIEDIILPERLMKRFAKGLDTNLVLAGHQGTGKTTLAKILATGRSTKFIDASLDTGIDTVRNTIVNFASTASLINPGVKKVCVLDEADNLSEASQKALRGTIEKFHKNCIFIFTANFPNKILDPLKSRADVIQFDFSDEEDKELVSKYAKRIMQILKLNDRVIEIDALKYLMKHHYPDLRAMLNALQAISNTIEKKAKITLADIQTVKTTKYEELYKFLLDEHRHHKIYQFIKAKYMNKEVQVMRGLGSSFIKYLANNGKQDKVGQIAMLAHKYNYESSRSDDKFITLLAFSVHIAEVLK